MACVEPEGAMVICDIDGNHKVHTVEELEAILSRRHDGGSNSFWMAESPGAYPQLALFVNNENATLNYLPREGVAGFRSVGVGNSLEPSGTTPFLISSLGDQLPVLNDAVISVSAALEAAREFFLTKQLPNAVKWLEL